MVVTFKGVTHEIVEIILQGSGAGCRGTLEDLFESSTGIIENIFYQRIQFCTQGVEEDIKFSIGLLGWVHGAGMATADDIL